MSFCTKELELEMFNLNKREGIKKRGCKELRRFSVVPSDRTMDTKLKHRRVPPEHQEMLFCDVRTGFSESMWSLHLCSIRIPAGWNYCYLFINYPDIFQVLGEKIYSRRFFQLADI